MDVVQHGGVAVLFREQSQLAAQTVDITLSIIVKGAGLGRDIVGQLTHLHSGTFAAPLLVHITCHTPHKGVESRIVANIPGRSDQLVENILGQILRFLAGGGSGNTVPVDGFGDLSDFLVQLFIGHGGSSRGFSDASVHLVKEFGNG